MKVNISDEDSVIVEQIQKLLGDQPTVSIDCSGAEQSIRVAIKVTIQSALLKRAMNYNLTAY